MREPWNQEMLVQPGGAGEREERNPGNTPGGYGLYMPPLSRNTVPVGVSFRSTRMVLFRFGDTTPTGGGDIDPPCSGNRICGAQKVAACHLSNCMRNRDRAAGHSRRDSENSIETHQSDFLNQSLRLLPLEAALPSFRVAPHPHPQPTPAREVSPYPPAQVI